MKIQNVGYAAMAFACVMLPALPTLAAGLNINLGGASISANTGDGGGTNASVSISGGSGGSANTNISLGSGGGSGSINANLGSAVSGNVNLNLGSGGGSVGVQLQPGSIPGSNPTALALNGGQSGFGSITNSAPVSGCNSGNATALMNLFNATNINSSSWRRATNVQIVPVSLCSSDRARMTQAIMSSGKSFELQSALAQNDLVLSLLGRQNYGPNQVAAVQNSGSQMIVYVY